MTNRPFSLNEFKQWIAEQKDLSDFFNVNRQQDSADDKFIGNEVRAKVSEQKLLQKIETEDNSEVLIAEFVEDGGTILGIDGKKVQIEVESGTFFLPRFCVKIRKID